MTGPIDTTLAREVLAGIITAPRSLATKVLNQLEPADFPHWTHATIFTALGAVDYTAHPEPGAITVQLNRNLLDAGHFTDRDNGLRAEILVIAETRGHPEQLPHLVRDLLNARFRSQVCHFATALRDRSSNYPLHDVDETLRLGVDELRRLRKRIPHTPALRPVNEEGAA